MLCTGKTTEMLTKHLREPLPSVRLIRPSTPEGVDEVIKKATHKQPNQRYTDANSVASAFSHAIGSSSSVKRATITHASTPTVPTRSAATQIDAEYEKTMLGVDTPIVNRPSQGDQGTSHDITPDAMSSATGALTFAEGTLDIENPYKGLRAFQEVDAADFFGRDALVAHLLARLSDTQDEARFLAVVGPSGSGKSSAVRAGLIPALRKGALAGSAAR